MLLPRALLYTLLVCAPLTAQSWKLVWSDEFDGPANTPPNSAKWGYDIGNNNGWGNQELESYTSSPANAALDGNGNLVIHVLNQLQGITSARIKTQDKFAIAYGKIEARIQIPYGQGIWPAFWMLGANITDVGWPQAGEIDVMENIGKEPNMVHATVHGPGYSGANGIGKAYALASGRFADAFHVFSVEWKPTSLEFFVDGTSYHKVTPQTLPGGTQWVYNTPFFILLNVAVGGGWPGYPDKTTTYPQTMTVDYVRVYRSTAEAVVNPGGVVNAASFTPQLSAGSLASVFGTGLADDVYSSLFDSKQNAFPASAAGVSVLVNGRAAPLTYVSPGQINFQIPWETTVSNADVQVVRGGLASNAQSTKFSPTAPSVFALPATEWFTPSGPATAIVTCTGVNCTLWGNGFGAPAQVDGAPALFARAFAQCTLTIENLPANVSYCGTAPGLIINQLNFTYPSGVPNRNALNATLTVGDASSTFQVPAPPAN